MEELFARRERLEGETQAEIMLARAKQVRPQKLEQIARDRKVWENELITHMMAVGYGPIIAWEAERARAPPPAAAAAAAPEVPGEEEDEEEQGVQAEDAEEDAAMRLLNAAGGEDEVWDDFA